jgi:chloride channel 3/4/5
LDLLWTNSVHSARYFRGKLIGWLFPLFPFHHLLIAWFQGLIGTLFIRANVWWSRYRKGSRLGQYPVMEVLGITLINGILAYPNPYTRMSSTRLIYLLFSQCGVANTDDLWWAKTSIMYNAFVGIWLSKLIFAPAIITETSPIPAQPLNL